MLYDRQILDKVIAIRNKLLFSTVQVSFAIINMDFYLIANRKIRRFLTISYFHIKIKRGNIDFILAPSGKALIRNRTEQYFIIFKVSIFLSEVKTSNSNTACLQRKTAVNYSAINHLTD